MESAIVSICCFYLRSHQIRGHKEERENRPDFRRPRPVCGELLIWVKNSQFATHTSYGSDFNRQVDAMGITEGLTAPRSPLQNLLC
jgi:hypothetical protein